MKKPTVLAAAFAIVYLSLICAISYVVAHFLEKYW